MSVESASSTPLEQMPLIARTQLRDVHLVSVEGQNNEQLSPNAVVEVGMEDWSYRAEAGKLFLRLVTTVSYKSPPPDSEVSSGETPSDSQEGSPELGRLVVAHTADFDLAGDPAAITPEQVDELIAANVLFIVFPYVRATVQRLAADLVLPPTVLPYLRRNLGPATVDAPSDEGGHGATTPSSDADSTTAR